VDIYTTIVNLTGVPAVSVPCGALGGLPVGAQLIGKAFDEGTLLRIAYSLEKACAISDRRHLLQPRMGGEASDARL